MDKRIYVVLAGTVQSPLKETTTRRLGARLSSRLSYMPETRTIVQPAGRLIAQAAHVVSKLRVHMVIDSLLQLLVQPKRKHIIEFVRAFTFEPITTIILSARDSFELCHVLNLLLDAGIDTKTFFDTNPEYGDEEVMTAIATEPVTPEEVIGLTDYLPLWKP